MVRGGEDTKDDINGPIGREFLILKNPHTTYIVYASTVV